MRLVQVLTTGRELSTKVVSKKREQRNENPSKMNAFCCYMHRARRSRDAEDLKFTRTDALLHKKHEEMKLNRNSLRLLKRRRIHRGCEQIS